MKKKIIIYKKLDTKCKEYVFLFVNNKLQQKILTVIQVSSKKKKLK